MRQPSSIDTDDLARLVERLADRLRHLSPVRTASLEREVRAALAELAAMALSAQGEPDRPLPQVASRAWGDQVAVLGADLVDGLRRQPDPVLQDRAASLLVGLRRALP